MHYMNSPCFQVLHKECHGEKRGVVQKEEKVLLAMYMCEHHEAFSNCGIDAANTEGGNAVG